MVMLGVTLLLVWSASMDRWSLAHRVPFWRRVWLPISSTIEGLPVRVPLSYGIIRRARGLRIVYRFPPLNRGQTLFHVELSRVADTAVARLRTQKLERCGQDPSKCMEWFADAPRNNVLCTEAPVDSLHDFGAFGFCRPGVTPVFAFYGCHDERCGIVRQILANMFKQPES
jgi:hypothetical protein